MDDTRVARSDARPDSKSIEKRVETESRDGRSQLGDRILRYHDSHFLLSVIGSTFVAVMLLSVTVTFRVIVGIGIGNEHNQVSNHDG